MKNTDRPNWWRRFQLAFWWVSNSLTLPQLRYVFKSAYGDAYKNAVVTQYLWTWKQVLYRWVDLCTDEKEAKGAFFSAREGSNDLCEPIVLYAGLKWLTFLTDWQNEKHRDDVFVLSLEWSSSSRMLSREAHRRRDEFAEKMLEAATTSGEAYAAFEIASSPLIKSDAWGKKRALADAEADAISN